MFALERDKILKDKGMVQWAIKGTKDRIMDIAKNDKIHTASFYNEFLETFNNFYKAIEKTMLPALIGNWAYIIIGREDGLELCMRELIEIENNKKNILTTGYNVNSNHTLLKVRCKMYTLSDYAKETGVTEPVVVQKIRRGVLSSAVKVSNFWYIPALSKHAIDTPKETRYTWGNDIIFTPEYEYLKDFNEISIKKSEDDKKLYSIKLTYKDVREVEPEFTNEDNKLLENNGFLVKWGKTIKDEIKVMNTAEKERLEGMLIANNFVTCVSNKLLEIIY